MQLKIQDTPNTETESIAFEKKVVQHQQHSDYKISQRTVQRREKRNKNNERKHEKNEMKKSIFYIPVQSKRKPFFHFPLLLSSPPPPTLFSHCRLIYHLGWWFCLMPLASLFHRAAVVVQYAIERRRFLFIKSLPVNNDFFALYSNKFARSELLELRLALSFILPAFFSFHLQLSLIFSFYTSQSCRCSGNFCRLSKTKYIPLWKRV